MAVIDASALVAVLTGGEDTAWVESQLGAPGSGQALWAPHLIDAEIGNSLRRLVAAGRLEDEDAASALRDLIGMPLRRIVHTGLLDRAWLLRHNLTFYDALYVALAELLDAPLLTLDARLAKAAAATAGIDVLSPR
jgi:predicted nucleic acid-binding protein